MITRRQFVSSAFLSLAAVLCPAKPKCYFGRYKPSDEEARRYWGQLATQLGQREDVVIYNAFGREILRYAFSDDGRAWRAGESGGYVTWTKVTGEEARRLNA